MAFLFKSKKHQEKAAAATRDFGGAAPGSQNSLQSNGRVAGAQKDGMTEKAVSQNQTTPASSVNNSVASLAEKQSADFKTSPEMQNGSRMGQSPLSDLPLRNTTAPAVQPPLSNSNASLYPWSQKRLTYTSAHPSPFPRYGAAVNSVSSKEGDIYLMGGLINSATVKGDLWMVEAGAGNMACYPLATTAEGPGPRVGHASLLVGNAFIVYGGDTKMEDTDVLDETLYLLNTSTRQWSRAVPAGPRPSGRYGHSLNILGSKIYVFGGQVEGYFMNDLVAFDLNQLQVPTNRWEFLIRNSDEGGPPQGQIPPARTNHTIVTFNEKLYLFGGTNGYQWFNDVWSYDPATNAWTQLDCIGYIPAPREGHAAALVDDVMYIFGGRTEEGADLGDLAAFRISSRRWYTFQNMGPSPSPRSGHSMTAYNKQIVVLAGEPSAATREVQDLSIVYVLDTSKIRYPNDQQIQSTPAGERVPGGRRPSGADKSGMGASRGLSSREGPMSSQGLLVEQKRLNGPTSRDSTAAGQSPRLGGQPGINGNDVNGFAPGSAQPQAAPAGTISRPPPMSSGPPPQSQAPQAPKASSMQSTQQVQTVQPAQGIQGVQPMGPPPANAAKAKQARGYGPTVITGSRSSSREREPLSNAQNRTMSPNVESPNTKISPAVNGRRTPTEQAIRVPPPQPVEVPVAEIQEPVVRSNSRTKQNKSIDSTTESSTRIRPSSPPPPTRQGSNAANRRLSNRNSQSVALLKELEVARNTNAWLNSELELAKKSGYTANPSSGPLLDRSVAETFSEADRPLIEALIAMRTELANVQSSIDQQAILAAKKIAEVEKQRDVAVNEAVYAKAKLAAHGGSASSTPQLDNDREFSSRATDRSNDIGKKLASSYALQTELQSQIDRLTVETDAEKRGRQLAEDTANAAQARILDLETYKQNNSSEIERLKAELHELSKEHREQTIVCAAAVAASKLLQADKDELESKHQELLGSSKDNSETFDALREAMASSNEMQSLLERKLQEEQTQREVVEDKLRRLRSEHEERTAELETIQKKLRDSQDIAEKHANEAQAHRQAVMSGLDRAVRRDLTPPPSAGDRTAALLVQLETANLLVRKNQAAADSASEKLRSAEERIAGLEAYQEQVSREGLSIRKQLQTTMRETQTLQASNSEMKHQLANQQLETNAVNVQHSTLKDLLVERGISPVGMAARTRNLSSPQNRSATPEQSRIRDLELQVATAHAAHEETKTNHAVHIDQAESAYREKLGQLENDYQSAVHYVKGTEKMLKRMKDELSRYKSENLRIKSELEEAHATAESVSRNVPSDWESERSNFHTQIESLQKDLAASHSNLETQLAAVRSELKSSSQDRDFFKKSHADAQEQLTATIMQTRSELSQLQQENSQLERRAIDAESKVSSLLDQLETSVDNYRRQSRLPPPLDMSVVPEASSPTKGHTRNISAMSRDSMLSLGGESNYSSPTKDRNSMALDSLATELETLRSHWETTNKNYRLSGMSTHNVDFDKTVAANGVTTIEEEGELKSPTTPKSADKVELSSSLADWRKRLDAEEAEARSRKATSESPKAGQGEKFA